MIGNIRAYNDDILRRRRRELGHLPIPVSVSKTEWEGVDFHSNPIRVPRIPYIGRERVKGFRAILDEPLFVDISGWGTPGERALTQSEFVEEALRLTEEHGTLWWGLVEVGQFQGYVQAWKHKGA